MHTIGLKEAFFFFSIFRIGKTLNYAINLMWCILRKTYVIIWEGIILNINRKTKVTIKAREDLANLNIRKELHIQEIGIKPYASYTLIAAKKVHFLTFLKSVKFSDGFASNISRCVNVNEGKISFKKPWLSCFITKTSPNWHSTIST